LLFTDLPIEHQILKNLELKGLTETTEIQSQAIPYGLMGKDLLASSKTGSGKTLAFLVPALQRVLKSKPLSRKDPRVLILAPTRELAKQVFLQLKWLIAKQSVSAVLILGGENFNDQVKALRRHPQFIVGTAGRIADHLSGKTLFLNGLELLIMDEADRMLDLGFAPQLKDINRAADHRKRQTMMFSATLDSAPLHYLTEIMLKAPQRISVGQANEQHKDIEQRFYFADHIEHKEALLFKILEQEQYQQVMIFTATRADTERLSKLLNEQGKQSIGLSAELSQGTRSNVMNEFSRNQQQILVTTDVASRGLDLLKVSLVINFDMPKLADEYVHRVGRTGRAGNKGQAISLIGPKDWLSFTAVKGFLQQDITFSEIEGLPAKFKGLKENKFKGKKPVTDKVKAKVKKPTAVKKRVKSMDGVDAGHIPMLRRARKEIVDDDEQEEIE
jgi:superfamily II DNA/RNA helicase